VGRTLQNLSPDPCTVTVTSCQSLDSETLRLPYRHALVLPTPGGQGRVNFSDGVQASDIMGLMGKGGSGELLAHNASPARI
jgi:hypothetical protein